MKCLLKGCWWSGTHLEPFRGVGQLWRREAISPVLIFLCESAVFPLSMGHFSSMLFTLYPHSLLPPISSLHKTPLTAPLHHPYIFSFLH